MLAAWVSKLGSFSLASSPNTGTRVDFAGHPNVTTLTLHADCINK